MHLLSFLHLIDIPHRDETRDLETILIAKNGNLRRLYNYRRREFSNSPKKRLRRILVCSRNTAVDKSVSTYLWHIPLSFRVDVYIICFAFAGSRHSFATPVSACSLYFRIGLVSLGMHHSCEEFYTLEWNCKFFISYNNKVIMAAVRCIRNKGVIGTERDSFYYSF